MLIHAVVELVAHSSRETTSPGVTGKLDMAIEKFGNHSNHA
jgi:hypothetical protein